MLGYLQTLFARSCLFPYCLSQKQKTYPAQKMTAIIGQF